MRFYQTPGIVAAIALLASVAGPASAGHGRSTSVNHGSTRSPAFANVGPAPRHLSRRWATNTGPFAGCHSYLICPPNEGTDCNHAHIVTQCPRKFR
jgi:hypothetical protein